VSGRRKFRFKNKLVSLDSTVIDLCATLFDWAKFRRTKGAVKLHLLLDHDGYLPSVAVITEGKRHDVRVARTLRFDPGTILVMDRGYVDYEWFGTLTADGVFFVTRLKDNAVYAVEELRAVPEPQSRPTGRGDSVDRRRRREQVSPPAAPGGGGGSRHRGYPGVRDQPPHLWGHHHRGHLQGPLADRAVLQGAETEPQGQDLRGDQRRWGDLSVFRGNWTGAAQAPG
jgi:Transposase DDE domain